MQMSAVQHAACRHGQTGIDTAAVTLPGQHAQHQQERERKQYGIRHAAMHDPKHKKHAAALTRRSH